MLSVLMTAVLIVGLLAGCGSSSSDSENRGAEGLQKEDVGIDGSIEEESITDTEHEDVTITMLVDKETTITGLEAVCELAKKELGITVEIEKRVGGVDGDNIVKTRLASGDMSDICVYNSGCKFSMLNPSEYFLDLSNQEFIDKVDDSYLNAVTVEGAIYGVPAVLCSSAGVVLYNKDLYEEYNLEVPHTWDDFLKNCDVLKAAGEVAVIGSFAESWTTQVIYLGDHYNVQAENPDFAVQFNEGKAKYATDPAGLRSWQKAADLASYYNEDYTATTYNVACDMLVNGDGAHWIINSNGVLNNIYSNYGDDVNKVGAFGIPGDSADDHGITTWPSNGFYVNKNSEHIDDILRFLDFWLSEESVNTYLEIQPPAGPIVVKGVSLPDDAFEAVKDEQAYIDAGKACPALEYQTAVKGASCEQITQEVGTRQISAEEAAKAYDDDCLKQAVQLGLDWE
jgi:raffinose/stachyose/melibiose transport system substrate-binding protein